MKYLLRKELALAIHPTNLIFLGLSMMFLIPAYPYTVIFFYTGMGIFFICLTARENQDIPYSITLPVAKRDLVTARFLLVIAIQLLQVLVGIPFILFRNLLVGQPNVVGMEANPALLGFCLLMMACFNLCFFGIYYRNVQRVGVAFLWSSLLVFIFIGLVEASVWVLPFVRDTLDTTNPADLPMQWLVLGGGIVLYGLFTYLAWRKAQKDFLQQDI